MNRLQHSHRAILSFQDPYRRKTLYGCTFYCETAGKKQINALWLVKMHDLTLLPSLQNITLVIHQTTSRICHPSFSI